MSKQNLALGAAVGIAFLALILGVVALNEAGQPQDIQAMGVTNLSSLTLSDDLVVGGTATQTGAADFASTLQFGTDNLYALGHASSGKQIVCGTTGVFTDSTDLAISALSSIDGIVVAQITTPSATALHPHVSAVSGYTATIKTLEADYTAGTTGANIYYCAVGNQ